MDTCSISVAMIQYVSRETAAVFLHHLNAVIYHLQQQRQNKALLIIFHKHCTTLLWSL